MLLALYLNLHKHTLFISLVAISTRGSGQHLIQVISLNLKLSISAQNLGTGLKWIFYIGIYKDNIFKSPLTTAESFNGRINRCKHSVLK